ncbi:MAG: hypothetical protein NXI04_01380 [Planctomycetaceae bacterium]|nr:hypothetical protein [Planctomycetaceae bacterium]
MSETSDSNLEKMSPVPDEARPPESAAPIPGPATINVVRSDVQTSDMIEGYHVIAEWIRFADAKAAVVLTVGGAIAGLVIPTLKNYLQEDVQHPAPWWTTMVCVLFSVWLLLILLSGIAAFSCILPFRRRGKHPALGFCSHFHPAAIGAAYTLDEADKFQTDCEGMGDAGLRREVAACLLIDSHISGVKYRRVSTSIRLMGASAIVSLIYLIAIQF